MSAPRGMKGHGFVVTVHKADDGWSTFRRFGCRCGVSYGAQPVSTWAGAHDRHRFHRLDVWMAQRAPA